MKKAIFIDRDGVIIKMHYDLEFGTVDTPTAVKQVEFIPNIFEFLQFAKERAYLLILVSNQPGVGIKKINLRTHNAIKEFISKSLYRKGISFDGQYYCMHHPYATLTKYKKICTCRKPKPGLILKAAKEHNIDLNKSWVIGDGVHDIVAGNAAGCKTILIGNVLEAEYLRIIEEKLGKIKPTCLVKNINEIINILG